MDGILNINKPTGVTSFDVVAKIRRLTGTKKVGHAGTLDPDASGVLPVCIGKGTKVIEFLMEKDKTYRVGLYLGKATDTQDATGTTLYEKPVEVTNAEIEKCIKEFIGEVKQTPPMYSAIRVDGKRLYELARQGIEIERKPRTVTFFSIDIKSMERQDDKVFVILDVSCSKGTYMRTLCHDIGEKLGCGGHMFSLIRTRSGPFSIDESYSLDDLEKLNESGQLDSALMPMDKAILRFSEIYVSEAEGRKLKNGLALNLKDLKTGLYRIYLENGGFLAIGQSYEKDGVLKLKTYKWIDSANMLS